MKFLLEYLDFLNEEKLADRLNKFESFLKLTKKGDISDYKDFFLKNWDFNNNEKELYWIVKQVCNDGLTPDHKDIMVKTELYKEIVLFFLRYRDKYKNHIIHRNINDYDYERLEYVVNIVKDQINLKELQSTLKVKVAKTYEDKDIYFEDDNCKVIKIDNNSSINKIRKYSGLADWCFTDGKSNYTNYFINQEMVGYIIFNKKFKNWDIAYELPFNRYYVDINLLLKNIEYYTDILKQLGVDNQVDKDTIAIYNSQEKHYSGYAIDDIKDVLQGDFINLIRTELWKNKKDDNIAQAKSCIGFLKNGKYVMTDANDTLIKNEMKFIKDISEECYDDLFHDRNEQKQSIQSVLNKCILKTVPNNIETYINKKVGINGFYNLNNSNLSGKYSINGKKLSIDGHLVITGNEQWYAINNYFDVIDNITGNCIFYNSDVFFSSRDVGHDEAVNCIPENVNMDFALINNSTDNDAAQTYTEGVICNNFISLEDSGNNQLNFKVVCNNFICNSTSTLSNGSYKCKNGVLVFRYENTPEYSVISFEDSIPDNCNTLIIYMNEEDFERFSSKAEIVLNKSFEKIYCVGVKNIVFNDEDSYPVSDYIVIDNLYMINSNFETDEEIQQKITITKTTNKKKIGFKL